MFGQPPAPAAPPPPPATYGAPQGQGGYGSGPGAGYAPAPSSYPDRGSGGPGGTYGSGGMYGGPGDSGRSPEPDWSAPSGPSGGSSSSERKPRRGLIIALILTAVVVVVGAGGYVGWSMKNGDSDFSIGKCVQQRGSDAVIVDCSVAGSYEIKSIVDTDNGCPDANQPSLVLTSGAEKKYACLVPAAG
jgi:hypothetical protein